MKCCKMCGIKMNGTKIYPVFCSKECHKKYMTTLIGAKSPRWKGGLKEMVCRVCGVKFKLANTFIRQGAGKTCSRKCDGEWKMVAYKAEDNPNWKNGITKPNRAIRRGCMYARWRKKVFSMLMNKCHICGGSKNLHAHHIVPIKDEPTKILVPENGIILCKNCHYGVHKGELKCPSI